MDRRDPIKVYDARWMADEFEEKEIVRLFEAVLLYGRELGADTLTLGRDARVASGRVAELGLETALRMGYRVFLCPEPVSTPLSYFTSLRVSARYPHTMGFTVTASHNPREYTGLKITVPGVRAVGEGCGPSGGLTRVRDIYHSGEKARCCSGGTLSLISERECYIATALSLAGLKPGALSGLSVALECLAGVAGPEIWRGLRDAGAGVEALNLVPDGTFPKGSPNPTSAGKMDEALALAKDRALSAVIGLDGDGDRIVFGDPAGILNAGFSVIPVLEAVRGLKSDRLPIVLADPKVTPLALSRWSEAGFSPLLFRNGHSQIKDYMTEKQAVMAAEESGHYYHGLELGTVSASLEYSLLTILLFLRRVAEDSSILKRIRSLQDSIYSSGEINYQFGDDEVRDRAMERALLVLKEDGAVPQAETPDGISLGGVKLDRGVFDRGNRYELGKTWYSSFVRVSTNEKAVVRVFLTACDEATGKPAVRALEDIFTGEFSGKRVD
jgi:phosphomannomutase